MKTIEQLKAELNAAEDGLYKKVLENNLKAVTYSDDVVNTVLTVINKYTGKKIGDKTMDKINAELQKSITDIRIYFVYNWDHTRREGIKIYRHESTFPYLAGQYDDIELYHKDYESRNLFDENSAFKGLAAENVRINGRVTYIEDIESYVSEKTEQFNKIHECAKQYERLVKDFRANGVKGLASFDNIYPSHRITQ